MAVVLDGNVLDLLDALDYLAERHGASDAGHILETDLVCAELDELLGHVHIVLDRMDGRAGDAERALGDHPGLVGIGDGRRDIAYVIQTAESAGDVGSLRLLDLVEQLRRTERGKEIYAMRKETIERVFADAKEKHAMRYTHHRGLARVTNWVRLKYAAMNLKKLAIWKLLKNIVSKAQVIKVK